MIPLLLVRFNTAPLEIEREFTITTALLGMFFALMVAVPALTLRAPARTSENATVPAPVLRIVLPVAVTLRVIANPVPEELVTVVSSFKTIGAAMVWLPAVTLNIAWPLL